MTTQYSANANARMRSATRAMRHVPVDSSLDEPLDAYVSHGFTAMTVERFYDGGLCAVVLWRDDGSGLEISARQIDAVAIVCDVGVLCVGPALAARPDDARALPVDLHAAIHTTTLFRLEGGRTIACGIAFTGSAGSRIVLVAGAWPYAVELDAAFAARDARPLCDTTAGE